MDEVTRYPLSWPTGWKRTMSALRRRATFSEATLVERSIYETVDGRLTRTTKMAKGSKRITLPTARERLAAQLEWLEAKNALTSTNLQLTSFGLPRADRSPPSDPGVAVYFELHGKDRVLACDRWETVAENIAAIANHIDAIRRVERYGVGTLDQAFMGYDALPPPGADNRPAWRPVLGFKPLAPVTADDVKVNFRALAKAAATDEARLRELNLARDAALAELGASP
jgi:hypothetical protein